MEIHSIVLDIVALNISDMVNQHNYGEINIDEPKAEGFYVVQFTSIPYKLQYSIEVNDDTITEVTLLCDAKYMSTTQENSLWYLDTEYGSMYITVSLKTILVPE